ncbi:MAG TPA: hypothetical protein VLJ37_05400 [bacterium]|nr:hypothetical protein [bacterium]
MKRNLFMFAIAALLAAGVASAAERPYKPHSKLNDPQLVLQLRQQMTQLESGFVEIENNITAGGVDYDKITALADQMDAVRRTIQKVVPNKDWEPMLKGLNSQLQRIRKYSARQDPLTLRKEIDALYDSCFRCHAANAPRRYD